MTRGNIVTLAITSVPNSLSSMEDSISPYFFHNSNHPSIVLVSHHLTSANYNTWNGNINILWMLLWLSTFNQTYLCLIGVIAFSQLYILLIALFHRCWSTKPHLGCCLRRNLHILILKPLVVCAMLPLWTILVQNFHLVLLKLYSLVTHLVIKPINYLTCPPIPFSSPVMSFFMSQCFLSKMMTHNPIILIFSLILLFHFIFPFLPIIQQILLLVQFHHILIVPPILGKHLLTFKIIIVA